MGVGRRWFLRAMLVTAFAAFVLFIVWHRSALLQPTGSQAIAFRPITADAAEIEALQPFTLSRAWRLEGDPAVVAGLSGLDVLPDGRLLALGDRGSRIVIALPGSGKPHKVGLSATDPARPTEIGDTETVTVDPATAISWSAMETDNRIVRYAADGSRSGDTEPAAMAHWPENVGSEAMTRLPDGRFLVLGEVRDKGVDRTFPALLFPRDPLSGAEPVMAHLKMPGDYKPVGLANLPDGRVLVLGRVLRFPMRFRNLIAIADPRDIRAAGLWRAEPVAEIIGGALSDNYEGIATTPFTNEDGAERLKVWLVSDDNQQRILQSTKLLELEVDPARL